MLRFLIWVTGWFIEHRKKSWAGRSGEGGGDGRDKEVHVILVDLPLASLRSLISAYEICMAAGPGGAEPVPRADSWSSRSELPLCPLPPSSSSSEEANPAVGRGVVPGEHLRGLRREPTGSRKEACSAWEPSSAQLYFG